MKLIVGLGNPGNYYEKNYHNAGFIVIDEYCKRNSIKLTKTKFNGIYEKVNLNNVNFIIAKPLTFMNLSGNFVSLIANYFGISSEDILIIHDEKDLKINTYKYKFDGGHSGQNGIKNIIDMLGTKKFNRLRIGIGKENIKSIKNHVLSNFKKDEVNNLISNQKIYDSIDFFLSNSIIEVMNKYNEKV